MIRVSAEDMNDTAVKQIQSQLDDEWPEFVGRIRGVLENPNDDAREKIHKIESLVHHHDLRRVELYKELDQAIRS